MGRATFDTMSEFGTFLPFVASQHHGRYRGYRRHVTDGAGRPSLTQCGPPQGLFAARAAAVLTQSEPRRACAILDRDSLCLNSAR